VEKKPIHQIVERPDWQRLREELKGKWNLNPEENVRKLRAWIGPLQTTQYEKLRIVMNYLTGTGFRTGKIKHPSIQKLRDDISVELKRRKVEESRGKFKH
jgi:hypothetical protein